VSDNPWPADVYEDSGCRLPIVDRASLTDGARAIYDDHADPSGWSHAGLQGPGGIRLHSPRLAELWSGVGRYLRDETGLSKRVREVAILITAREHDSRFEWQQHERVAQKVGVPAETIDAIKHHGSLAGLDETDALVIRLGRQVFGDRSVDSDLFAAALARFGPQQLIDLISIMGTYAATAAMLALVDIQIPPDEEPLLPLP
jgi:4-carboxymuconolactone decarboxylase